MKNASSRLAWLAQPITCNVPVQEGVILTKILGSCLCRGVRFQINGPLTGAPNCHCSMCRKAHGSAFRSRARVEAKDFEFLLGENLVKFYESSPGTHRGFCSVCGSPIFSRFDDDKSTYGLPLGALDTDPGVKPEFHVFVSGKASWHEISDGFVQYDLEKK